MIDNDYFKGVSNMKEDDEFEDYNELLDKGINVVSKCLTAMEKMNDNHMKVESRYMKINFMIITFYIIATLILFTSCCNL